MTKTLIMFPGQGSQFVGMGKDLISEFPISKQTFEEADDALGFKISDICISGPDSSLTLTENTQPALLTASIAVWRIIQDKYNSLDCFFAGHSLGEYSALVAANKINFADAIKTVKTRGQAMQAAVPVGVGSMAAILGTENQIIEETCNLSSSYDNIVEIANYNSNGQVVISGHKKAVEDVCSTLSTKYKAKCIPLQVSAPFHSSLMKPAQETMTEVLKEIHIQHNDKAIIANIDAQIYRDSYNSDMLIRQITNAVLWTQSLNTANKNGVLSFVECGPGRVLSGLVKRTLDRNTQTASLFDVQELKKHLEL